MKAYAITQSGDLGALLVNYRGLPDLPIGEVLLKQRLIDNEQLTRVLEQQRSTGSGRPLGRLLVDEGVVSETELNIALAHKLAIPYVTLDSMHVDSDVLTLIPPDIAVKCRAFPLMLEAGALVVAMADPLDQSAVATLRFHAGRPVEPVMASADEVHRVQERYYSHHEASVALEDLKFDPVAQPYSSDTVHLIEREARKKPIVRLLNAIILQGVLRGASDINLRPEKDKVTVFYRVDGMLQFSRSLNRSIMPALVSRVKITGQMDIAERRLPQDGHARLTHGDKQIDLRLSVVPTVNGESVVIRILNKEQGVRALDELGLADDEISNIKRIIGRPNGLFLVTGPTGAGKTTTLYAILAEVKKRSPHILTVEDPVEYDIEGVEQVQVSNARDYTFARALRHFLRHDPDVIMVGEIRDEETAHIANKAALTGHLVFSTLHTRDAPTVVSRLIDMGVEAYLLSASLSGVLSQRLVRLNCRHCMQPQLPGPRLVAELVLGREEQFFRGSGCKACHYSGYSGRTTVVELLMVTPEMAQLIAEGRPAAEIRTLARHQGMRTLLEGGLAIAREGRTSLEEVESLMYD